MRWRNRDIEGTLASNYHADVLTVTPERAYLGWSGCRALETEFDRRFPHAVVHAELLEVCETVAVLAWRVGDGRPGLEAHGVDGFYIRRGRIFMQTREMCTP